MRTPDRHIKGDRNSDDTAKRPDIFELDFGASNRILHEMVDEVLGIYPIPEPEPESLPCLSAEELQALADTFKDRCGPSPPVPKTAPDDPNPNVPAELKALQQWVVWLPHVKPGDDKPSKLLYQDNGWAASTNAKRTWTTYDLALACYQKHATRSPFKYRYRKHKEEPYQHLQCYLAGIGFVFSPNDPYTGIDLDNCMVDGKLQPWATEILDRLQGVAYIEVSPSGRGIKIWTRAKLPAIAKHKVYINESTEEAIEAYDSVRYFTVTGRNGKGQIGDGQAAIDWLVSEYLTPETQPSPEPEPATPKQRVAAKPSQKSQTHGFHFKTADAVIERIRQSRQCHKFDALMRGDQTGYGSQSEADNALCSVIAFWSQDTGIIDAIFRQSALYRDKWDEIHKSDGTTYGEMTIEKAVSGKRETYTPRKSQRPQTRRRRRKPRDRRRKKCR